MRPSVLLIALTLLLYTNVSAQPQPQAQAPTPAEEFAAKLVAAGTDAERESLLAGRPEMLTAELRRALVAHGDAQRRRGQSAPALVAYQLAQKVAERANDQAGMAAAMHGLGAAHSLRGELALSLEWYAKSLKLKEALGDKKEIARTLDNMAGVNVSLGNYEEALRLYQRTLPLREALNDRMGVGDSQNGIGLVYDAQNNYPLALDFYERSLKIFEEIKDREGQAYALNNIGNMRTAAEEYGPALEAFRRSLALLEELKLRRHVSQSYLNIGNIHMQQGDYPAALAEYERSLAIKEELGDRVGAANALLNIAVVHYARGEHAKAAEVGARTADLARRLGRRDTLWDALSYVGGSRLALGQLAEARRALAESIETVEELRLLVAGGERDRQRFFENKVMPYQKMVELHVREGDLAGALAYAERSKARVLLDVLKSGRAPVSKAMTPAEQERERELKQEIVRLNGKVFEEKQRPKPDEARLAALEAELGKARNDHASFENALYAAHPELKVRRGEVRPLSVADAAELLPDAETALVEFVTGRDKTFLFVLTKTTNESAPAVRVYEIALTKRELAGRVKDFREHLAARGLAFRKPARELYDLLLKPAESELRGKTRLVVVPDAELWELPFQALQPVEGKYLIEQAEVAYAQSLSVLREMKRARRGNRAGIQSKTALLAFGNPSVVKSAAGGETLMSGGPAPLPEAERQVKALRELYGAQRSRVYTGAEAREDRLKAEAASARILHLATHGTLNDKSPLFSHVLLSKSAGSQGVEDGLLEAWEMMKLNLGAELVVLSACETARGRVGAGEGVVGMTWALFVAGSPATVVSQWKVEESSTTELMLEFHRRLREQPTAGALRAAALKSLRGGRHAHPFYWAGFVLVGDGG